MPGPVNTALMPANLARLLHPADSLPEGQPSVRRRLLLVAYHFPPSTAIGALRWEKLVHFLVPKGYEVDVLTLEPQQLARRDDARLRALPAGVRVFGVRHDAPLAERAWNALAAATRRFRSSAPTGHISAVSNAVVGGPNPRTAAPVSRPSLGRRARAIVNTRLHVANELAWARAAAAAGVRLSSETQYDAVITSGPPHHVHVAGALIHTKAGIPHIADFRDPWRLAESVARDMDPTTHAALAERYESRVVRGASFVITNTQAAAAAMQTMYPEAAERISAIMNGSDPEDRVDSPSRERFTLLYAGSLYLQRDPRVLFRACAPLVRELGLTPAQFAIQFLGPTPEYDGKPVPELAEPYGLREHVIMSGLVPRQASLEAAAAATHLVCLPDGQRLTIPAKLFEYVQLDAWLLAFAEPDSAMAMALSAVDADVVPPGNVERASACIRARWNLFVAGVRPVALGADGRFMRTTQAARLQALLDSLPRVSRR